MMDRSFAEGHSHNTDPLFWSVQWMANYYNKPSASVVLYAGLPREEQVKPQIATQMLAQVGIKAAWVQRKLPDISNFLFPVIYLREQGGACIITKRVYSGDLARYHVILPENDGGSVLVSEHELSQLGLDYVMLANPEAETRHLQTGLNDIPEEKTGHWLFSTLWRYKHYFTSAALAALLANVLTLASTFFTMNVYDRVIPTQAYATLWSLAVGVVIAMTFEMVSRIVRSHLIDVAGRKADILLGSMLFRKLMMVRMEHKPLSSGAFANQLREFESVRDFVTSATLSTLSDLPFCLLFILVIYLIGGPLVCVTLISVPIILLVSLYVQWPLAQNMRQNLAQLSAKQGVLIESIEGLEALRSAGGEGWMQRRWQDSSTLAAASAMRSKSLASKTMSIVSYIQQINTVATVVWGTYLIGAGTLTMGALVGTVIMSSRAIAPLASVVGLAIRFQQAKAALGSLNRFMQMPVYRDPAKRYLPAPSNLGNFSLNQISFHYPSESKQHIAPQVLSDINLAFRQGERVAIVGSIGSGKSTLLKLIARLYQPVSGQVLVDNIDAQQIDPAEWHNAVGYVGQEHRLFQGSLRENIIAGNPAVSAEELLHVIKLTGLDHIAARHPMGLEMAVGEMGQALSGGQRQLVVLARTLLHRPKVLLLDEPTSSMDSMTESKFIKQLTEMLSEQNVIIVTHRVPLLNLVDRLIVMEQGKISADGPKQDVIQRLQANDNRG
jgi:ATP-binding cassette, subfamily C, bacterial LapB